MAPETCITKSSCKLSSDLMASHTVSQQCQEYSSKAGRDKVASTILVMDFETDTSWDGSLEISGPTSIEDRTDFDKGSHGLV
ncbi:hypothetical protein llap_16084 [Limosa lapponica baueri]|uniref:Uncharacterized protein n=1 Tax=Limosa lapponica baueri TaxID=1758121 RepID=A0A2I0TIM4_LIMLA|nr:hypothetical protein llap_16084 [Limosa lapponica baueri]